MQDLKFAIRQLLKNPGFTAVAVLTLALGIGACTAIFSVVNAVLLRPLPYPESSRLVMVSEMSSKSPAMSVAYPNYLDWQQSSTAFEDIGIFRYQNNWALTGRAEAEHLQGATATASYFKVLGVPPLLGRTFTAEEDRPGGPPVAVLSYRLWRRHFNSDPEVVGRTVNLSGEICTVVGVLRAEFNLPHAVEVWRPLGPITSESWVHSRGNHFLQGCVGRLKAGVTVEQGRAELNTIARRLEAANPATNTGLRVRVEPLLETIAGDYRHGLLLLCGAVGMVMLIACVNLANLLLARGAGRRREIAVRYALGASGGQVIRLFLVEAVLLAMAGGLAGLLIAVATRDGMVALSPSLLVPRFQEITIDPRVLAFSFGVSLLSSVVFGLWPAWRVSRADPREAMQASSRTGSAGPEGRRAREWLVVAQVTLTLVLLVGAGLLGKSLSRMHAVNLGFDTSNLLTARVALSAKQYSSPDQAVAFFDRLMAAVKPLPGVSRVALSSAPPLRSRWQSGFRLIGQAAPPSGQEPGAEIALVSEDYFDTLGVSLLQGRRFGYGDRGEGVRNVVIDQAAADRFWPGQSPLGRQIGLGDHSYTIIGVVPTLRIYGYHRAPDLMQLYLLHGMKNPPDSGQISRASLVIRTAGDARALAGPVRKAVAAIDPDQPMYDVSTMEEMTGETFQSPRLYTYLLAIFAGLALLLAAVGIYGVMAYSFAQRTHEIGIRMAIGASPGQVVALVLRQGLRLLGLGLVAGVTAALALTRLMRSLLFEVSTVDPWVYASVAGGLAAIALLACWLPARRAARIKPMRALRCE